MKYPSLIDIIFVTSIVALIFIGIFLIFNFQTEPVEIEYETFTIIIAPYGTEYVGVAHTQFEYDCDEGVVINIVGDDEGIWLDSYDRKNELRCTIKRSINKVR